MISKTLKLLLVFSLFYHAGYSQWYNKKFVIGSFADPRVSRDNDPKKDSISFTLFKAASFNLLTGPQFYNGAQDFSLMDRTLDLANKYGLHLMVIDGKLGVTRDNFTMNDAQRIVAHFKSLDPKKREALGGYSFGGEFPMDKSSQVKKWGEFFNDNDTDRPAYTYMLPSYGFPNANAYEKYLDSYLSGSENSIKIVAYDYYPFISAKIMSTYFYSMAIIKKKAGDRPVWYYIQATTTKTHPDITDYQLKFMAFCPLAYGSKGTIYFTYESIPGQFGKLNYDALINPYGNVTRKYYTSKIINDYLSYLAGPIIMANKCVGTYHASTSPTGEDISSEYMLGRGNQYVSKISDQNVLVGVFKNEGSAKYYLMLINKSENDISGVKISIPGNKKIVGYPGSFKYHGSRATTNLPVSLNNNNTNFSIDKIPGGEMTIVEVD